jgi:hypothetical protein
MKTIKYMFLLVMFLTGFYSCKEQGRFEIGYSDSEAPGAPVYDSCKALYGGARLYYKLPLDRDLLSIDASYINTKGTEVWFSVSYYVDSIDVYGFNDTLEHTVQLYAVDRAGNKSAMVPVPVIPLEPALSRVAKSMTVKPGFASFFMDWKNELKQNINVYADFNYTQQGKKIEHKLIYTSTDTAVRWFVRNLPLTSQEPVSLKIRVEDPYGNITDYIDMGQITLLEDVVIPKDKWKLPETNDSIGGVPMGFFAGYEGRSIYTIDGIIDDGLNMNYGHTGGRGHTGIAGQGNMPWNILIDLGDEYEISRIITHQRYYGSGSTSSYNLRQYYYLSDNVGIYNMYIWDEAEQSWEAISRHKILFPAGLSDMEYKQLGMAGDMAYLYPDDPQFSKPTRRFRYEAIFGFGDNYTSTGASALSEITLYGKKK